MLIFTNAGYPAVNFNILRQPMAMWKGLDMENHSDAGNIRIAIISPVSLVERGKLLKKGFEMLGYGNAAVDIYAPSEGEDIKDFSKRIRDLRYDICIVNFHGAHNEVPVAFEDFGAKTILMVCRPEEVLIRWEEYNKTGKSLEELFGRVDVVAMLGKAMAMEYLSRFNKPISIIPHGAWDIQSSPPKHRTLNPAVVGSVATWSDMRWIGDVIGLMKEIRSQAPDNRIFGYVAGKFTTYKDPNTGENIDELDMCRKNQDCLILKSEDIEKVKFRDFEAFKDWLYMKSEKGNKVIVVEGVFSVKELKEWQSLLVDFNVQMYRERMAFFSPKVEYSRDLHKNPGGSLLVVFRSRSMNDVAEEGFNMVMVDWDNGQANFETAANEIIGLIREPARYNRLCRETYKNAHGLTIKHIAELYLHMAHSLLTRDYKPPKWIETSL